MYEFVTGPLAWLAFAVFFVGIVVRLVMYVRGLDWKLDRVTYSVNTSYGVRGRGALDRLLADAFRHHGWRANPMFTVFVFVMHIGLIVTPLFLLGHTILLQERWGVAGWSLPGPLADAMTVAVLISHRHAGAAPHRAARGAHHHQRLRLPDAGRRRGALRHRPDGPLRLRAQRAVADRSHPERRALPGRHPADQAVALRALLRHPRPARAWTTASSAGA